MPGGIRPKDGRKEPLVRRKRLLPVMKKMLKRHPDAGSPIQGSKYVVGYCHQCDTRLRCVPEAVSLPTCQDCWGDAKPLVYRSSLIQDKGKSEGTSIFGKYYQSVNVSVPMDQRLANPEFLA